jgi:alkylated DNA repair dioxygenase AlkB
MQTIVHMDGRDETRLITIPNILTAESYNNLKNCLKTLNYCKGYTQSGAEVAREQLWFHKENRYFCDSWVVRYPRWDSHPYPDEVLHVQDRVQEIVNEELKLKLNLDLKLKLNINSCLVNYYRDGNSFIPPHRDNQISFGERPTIVGLSIGATRTLLLKHNNKDVTYEIKLMDNSMFIMAGGSQLYFMHEIPKEPQCHEERWSLTFREHLF